MCGHASMIAGCYSCELDHVEELLVDTKLEVGKSEAKLDRLTQEVNMAQRDTPDQVHVLLQSAHEAVDERDSLYARQTAAKTRKAELQKAMIGISHGMMHCHLLGKAER